MEDIEYETRRKEIKRKCRTRFGLIVGGLAGLLLGGKFVLKNLDIDITQFPWALTQFPVYFAIGFATNHYAKKEPRDLNELYKAYKENQ